MKLLNRIGIVNKVEFKRDHKYVFCFDRLEVQVVKSHSNIELEFLYDTNLIHTIKLDSKISDESLKKFIFSKSYSFKSIIEIINFESNSPQVVVKDEKVNDYVQLKAIRLEDNSNYIVIRYNSDLDIKEVSLSTCSDSASIMLHWEKTEHIVKGLVCKVYSAMNTDHTKMLYLVGDSIVGKSTARDITKVVSYDELSKINAFPVANRKRFHVFSGEFIYSSDTRFLTISNLPLRLYNVEPCQLHKAIY